MKFTMTFYGPFHIGTGTAAPGRDQSVDPECLLPESSLKGLMRDAAVQLGVQTSLINTIFGSQDAQSAAWAWSTPEYFTPPIVEPLSRIKINAATGSTDPGALSVADVVWASTANFEIEPNAWLSDHDRAMHERVLVLAARGVRSLGAYRNRGYGWVSIEAVNQPPGLFGPSDVASILGET